MPRPKIKLPYSWLEKLIQILSFVALLGLIVLTAFSIIHLPERIPTHFNASGLPDGWGGKGALLMLPIIAVILYVAITIIERFSWAYNYAGIEINEKNADYLYRLGRQMLEWVKLILITDFLYLQWQTTLVARNLSTGLGSWFMPVFLLALFGGIGFSIHKMVRHQ